MKKIILISVLLSACYTKTKEPDHNFMSAVAQQAGLDTNLMTTIELSPAKFYFGQVRNADSLRSSFVLKNTGQRTFYIREVHTGCSCICIQYARQQIEPGDSLIFHYQMSVANARGVSPNAITVVGNCPAGNKTYYFEATIIH